jgi:Endodeoxyribonuclease RusA
MKRLPRIPSPKGGSVGTEVDRLGLPEDGTDRWRVVIGIYTKEVDRTPVNPFVMIIPRRPISSNKNQNPKFALAIDQAARSLSPAVFDGPLYARIVWFHKERTSQDADNIAKRILDALKGIVFVDDNIISHCLSVRVDAMLDYALTDSMSSSTDYQRLLELLADKDQPNVLYIEVGRRTTNAVGFGEVM